METTNTLHDFFRHRAHSLVERIGDARHHPTDERIRRVRVGIKRLRSLFRLIELIRPHRFKSRRHERALRKLFKQAGRVRELQVSQDALPHLSVPADVKKQYRLFLAKREHKARKKLKKALGQFHKKDLKPAARLVRRLGKKTTPAKIDGRLRAFIDREALAIDALQRAERTPESTHQARKHLKALLEIGTLLIQHTPDDALAKVLTTAKQLQTQIGTWHDKIVLLQQLEAFIATDNDLPPTTADRLVARQQQLATQQTQRLDQLNDSLRNLVEDLAPWRSTD
ncbi:CHAD domain-containing protein [Fibrella sp. HMF5335]|uniref:CHAD domain-containing protein n=1 Tax=Fibrella rubiginis TaxID=2817060 RepID=A0A939GMF8_9BACT|nr:CHAD domain-containing protein [Fibrella rubiginis]MBO0939122.1 CHAD domain-containing protein [Fibrella rubiginis]